MKNIIKKLKDIWSHEELRKKILITLGLVLIYRVGSFIVLPGVDSEVLKAELANSSGGGGLGELINLFSGGAFNRASIFSLGIMPYISASIIMQLMGIAVPAVQKMQKEGESGRKKINQYTRFLTIVITLFQAPGFIASSIPKAAIINDNSFWLISSVAILTCSTLFIMWLGERITDKGVGNGISLIIMIGIIATFPQSLSQEWTLTKPMLYLLEIAVLLVVIAASVMLVLGVRRVTVNSPRATVAAGNLPMGEAARSYIPLKVNSSGVMPIIFAQAIMFLPLYLQSDDLANSWIVKSLTDLNGLLYNLVFALMIILFTYFYTAITVNPNSIADDLKRNGNFIPGIKPGRPTAEFLDNILSKITLPGSIFLALIAILPAIVFNIGLTKSQGMALFFGGTSLLIMVGVILDTLQQIDSYLLSRHYDGLMKTGKMRGRPVGTGSISGIA